MAQVSSLVPAPFKMKQIDAIMGDSDFSAAARLTSPAQLARNTRNTQKKRPTRGDQYSASLLPFSFFLWFRRKAQTRC